MSENQLSTYSPSSFLEFANPFYSLLPACFLPLPPNTLHSWLPRENGISPKDLKIPFTPKILCQSKSTRAGTDPKSLQKLRESRRNTTLDYLRRNSRVVLLVLTSLAFTFIEGPGVNSFLSVSIQLSEQMEMERYSAPVLENN
jgi:hypothetical protein